MERIAPVSVLYLHMRTEKDGTVLTEVRIGSVCFRVAMNKNIVSTARGSIGEG